MTKPYIFTLLLACSFLLAPARGLCADQTLIIGAPPEGWPPFTIAQDSPLGYGIMTEVLTQICTAHGLEVTMAYFPEKRSRMMLLKGEIHAYPKAREWVSRPEDFDWTDPIVTSSDVLVFSRHRFPEGAPESIRGFTVGAILGFNYPPLQPMFDNKTITRSDAKSTESLMRMLLRGHIDVAVTNRYVAEWIIGNNADMTADDYIITETPIGSAPYRFAFTKARDYSRVIDIFNRELAAMKQDGRLQAIIEKYK